MKLFDAIYGHEVGVVRADKVISRRGPSYDLEGYAVVDAQGDVVGIYDNGKFFNGLGELMAVAEGPGK